MENTMAIMTIEYNEQNKYTRQVLEGLIGSGIIRRHDNVERNRKITTFKAALRESKKMAIDISQNGTAGYKTLDDLLNED